MKTWGGRFEREPDQRAADFSRSIEVDSELAVDDLVGSMAHARALSRAGILTTEEVDGLVAGLEGLLAEVRAGAVVWRPDLEDVPAHDPIPIYRDELLKAGVIKDDEYEAMKTSAAEQVEDAIAFAKNSPTPDPLDHLSYVFAEGVNS